MDVFNTNDFKNLLVLKNQLITLNQDELKDIYQDYSNYLLVLDTIAVLISIDIGFLVLNDNYIDKIEKIIQYHRFDVDASVFDIINDMIQYLNIIKNYSLKHKSLLKKSYCAYQEDIRKVNNTDINTLIRLMAHDAYLLVALEEEDMNIVYDDQCFLSSLNYFIENAPEILQDRKNQIIIQKRLDDVSIKPWPFSKKIKLALRDTKKNFIKVKQKEE